MDNTKILMLGWEFPPILNGGLGIASLGLCKALSQYAQISLILPRANEVHQIEKMKIYGLDEVNIKEYFEVEEQEQYTEFVKKIHYVDTELDPYSGIVKTIPVAYEQAIQHQRTRRKTHIRYRSSTITLPPKTVEKLVPLAINPIASPDLQNVFQVGPVYGNNLLQKVKAYTAYIDVISDSFEFDVIHAHDWMTFLAGMALKEKTGKPLVAHIHSLQYDRSGLTQQDFITDIERRICQHADRIITVSKYTAGKLIQEYNCDVRKIKHIHNGISWNKKIIEKRPFPFPLVLFAGRITQQKNPLMFLRMAKQVLAAIPNVRFMMIGDGDLWQETIEQAAVPELIGRCIFTGQLPHEKVLEAYASAQVYCLTSNSEPFGLTALEAAKTGIPVVLTARSGISEILKDTPTVPINAAESMANAVVHLLQDQAYADHVVTQNFMALKNSTWGEAARKVLKLYEQVLPKQQAVPLPSVYSSSSTHKPTANVL
ncbi:glycosyltransferase [Persicobacter psychrovividus]|uniref:Glycosyltransferase family 1 protein n=1 Tax=Persicobacter psychrovividus TaxID=387638 RepID=A0ABM7VHA9_9BACT|nr:hypothetical protein PEPS_26400 [Persicobacter psychrovividus]